MPATPHTWGLNRRVAVLRCCRRRRRQRVQWCRQAACLELGCFSLQLSNQGLLLLCTDGVLHRRRSSGGRLGGRTRLRSGACQRRAAGGRGGGGGSGLLRRRGLRRLLLLRRRLGSSRGGSIRCIYWLRSLCRDLRHNGGTCRLLLLLLLLLLGRLRGVRTRGGGIHIHHLCCRTTHSGCLCRSIRRCLRRVDATCLLPAGRRRAGAGAARGLGPAAAALGRGASLLAHALALLLEPLVHLVRTKGWGEAEV